MEAFRQIRFQEELQTKLVQTWLNGGRTSSMRRGACKANARRKLEKIGYTYSQAWQVVNDAEAAAELQILCEYR